MKTITLIVTMQVENDTYAELLNPVSDTSPTSVLLSMLEDGDQSVRVSDPLILISTNK